MNKFIIILIGTTIFSKNLFAAEAGMPQLDPKYWASQAFWLIIIFFSLLDTKLLSSLLLFKLIPSS